MTQWPNIRTYFASTGIALLAGCGGGGPGFGDDP